MLIYRDENGIPNYVAYVLASELGNVMKWAHENGFILGPELLQRAGGGENHNSENRQFVEMIGQNTPRISPRYPHVWFFCELIKE